MARTTILAVLALAGVGAAVPAQAAGCWSMEQVAAAKVRDLQSRMMVATLRCNAMQFDISNEYNAFVEANKATIQGANGVLKAYFNAQYGARGQDEYDRFATALANHYGDAGTDPALCRAARNTAIEAANARGDGFRLLAIEERLGVTMALPGGHCALSFASAQAPMQPNPVLTPVPAPLPVVRAPAAPMIAAPVATDVQVIDEGSAVVTAQAAAPEPMVRETLEPAADEPITTEEQFVGADDIAHEDNYHDDARFRERAEADWPARD